MPVARKLWQPIRVLMPAFWARRRIIRQTSAGCIELLDRVGVPIAGKTAALFAAHRVPTVLSEPAGRFEDPDAMFHARRASRAVAEGTVPSQDSSIAVFPRADVALTPKRDIDITVLRKILDAARELYSDTWLGFREAELVRWATEAGLDNVEFHTVEREEKPPHFQSFVLTARRPANPPAEA